MDREYGRHFNKYDIERIGIFGEMSYMNGKGYVSPFAPAPKDPKTRGIGQMLGSGPKIKSGRGDCYFDHEYQRLFIKEAWIDPTTTHREERLADLKRRVAGDFIPAAGPKKHSGSGDYFGTFGGKISEFSPIQRPQEKPPKEPPNFSTNPAKKGGPGYTDICFAKFPEHQDDMFGGDPEKLKQLKESGKPLAGPFIGLTHPRLFDKNPNHALSVTQPHYVKPPKVVAKVIGSGTWIPTGPAKKDGGCKAGALNKWPTHMADAARPQERKKDTTGIFYPQARNKSMYTSSISYKSVDRSCNNMNWRTFNRTSFPSIM